MSAASSQPAVLRPTSADRVLAALRCLAEHPKGVALDQLARELELPKSSAHRALATLCRNGFADHDEGGDYRLGLELVRLVFAFHRQLDRPRLVEPVLAALAERFGETAHYAELDGAEVVYLAKVTPGTGGVQMTSQVGGRNPAHCTGVGKALLAAVLQDREAVDAFVADCGPLVRRTERTIVDAAALDAELETTRARGYALDDEESEPGINCLAFALYLDEPGRPAGAVSVAAVAQRTPLADLVAAAEDVRQLIEARLGTVTR
ncbi:MAG TPA: IclR family transcriptional regulator [Gaiellaceae bacterium]|nr:IclR family transcriptional regulator [Gaiellaceae bacterium]